MVNGGMLNDVKEDENLIHEYALKGYVDACGSAVGSGALGEEPVVNDMFVEAPEVPKVACPALERKMANDLKRKTLMEEEESEAFIRFH